MLLVCRKSFCVKETAQIDNLYSEPPQDLCQYHADSKKRNPRQQAQINADLYNTTIDTGDVTATPTGFVAEGYTPSAAAAATRVADASAARNELLGRNQAYLVQDPSLSTQAGHTLGNIYNVRNLGGNLAQMMTAEDFEPTNVDDLNEQLVALGAPITAPINTTGILSGIANIQANNAMINAQKT